jgi:hypothetical protein
LVLYPICSEKTFDELWPIKKLILLMSSNNKVLFIPNKYRINKKRDQGP